LDDEVDSGIRLISETNHVNCYKIPENLEVVKPDSDEIMCFKRYNPATKNINNNKK